jgi:hypothetical protein
MSIPRITDDHRRNGRSSVRMRGRMVSYPTVARVRPAANAAKKPDTNRKHGIEKIINCSTTRSPK